MTSKEIFFSSKYTISKKTLDDLESTNIINDLDKKESSKDEFLLDLTSTIQLYLNYSSDFLYNILEAKKENIPTCINELTKKNFNSIVTSKYTINKELSSVKYSKNDTSIAKESLINEVRNTLIKCTLSLGIGIRDIALSEKKTISVEFILADDSKMLIELNELFVLSSLFNDGRLDLFLKFHIIDKFISNYNQLNENKSCPNHPILTAFEKSTEYLIKVLKKGLLTKFHLKEYEEMVAIFTHKNFLSEYTDSLFELVNLFQNFPDQLSIEYLEKLIIQLLGHWEEGISEEAVVLLNMIYDNNNFQENYPLETEIKRRNDTIQIEYKVLLKNNSEEEVDETINSIFCFVNKPNSNGTYSLNYCSPNLIKVTDISKSEKEFKAEILFQFIISDKASVCGYYDYQIVKFNKFDGKFYKPENSFKVNKEDGINQGLNGLSNYSVTEKANEFNENDDDEEEQTYAENKGRYVVVNEKVDDLSIHEVFPDTEFEVSSEIQKNNNRFPQKKRLDFNNLAKRLVEYKEKHINCLYIMGALERDNVITFAKAADKNLRIMTRIDNPEASPMAITCRQTISNLLGGEAQFNNLLKSAEELDMKVILDSLTRISSSRAHRKYRHLYLNKLDEKGKLNFIYGTEGYSVSYDDTAILNYRLKECWDLMINDLLSLTQKHKINGIHMDSCQSWPQMNEVNKTEMFRKDVDGFSAYSDDEILSGKVVLPNEEAGYWSSDNSDYYANPFLIKLTKAVWKQNPNFLFVGECWSKERFKLRHVVFLRSGIIPRMYTLPRAISMVLGRKLHRNGYIELCTPEKVGLIKEFLDQNYKYIPKGSTIIQSNSGQVWPYPALLYSRGNWAAVDLLFTLPDVPMTFMNEIYGEAYRVQINSVYEKKDIPNIEKSMKSRQKSFSRLGDLKNNSKGDLNEDKGLKKDLNSSNIKIKVEPNYDDPNIHLSEQNSSNFKKYFPKISSRHSIKDLNKYQLEEKIQATGEIGTQSSLSGINKNSIEQIKYKQEELIREVGPQFGFDLNKINLHYEHRRKLRNEHKCLRTGELIYLKTYNDKNEDHASVLAYARRNSQETGVIIINFSFNTSDFRIDFQELLKSEKVGNKSVCFIQNWQNENSVGENQLLREVLAENSTKRLYVSYYINYK